MKVKIEYLLCLLSFTGLSCSSMNDLMESAIQKPNVTFSQLKIDGLSFEAADLLVELEISNPNMVGISLSGFDYKLLLNESSFLKGQQDNAVDIPASGSTKLPIPLTLNYQDVYSTFNSLKSQDSTSYEVKCGVSFDLPVLGEQYIPVSRKGSVPLLKIPRVGIGALKVNNLGFTGAELELALELNNPNSLAFVLTGIDYNLSINNQQWLAGESNNRQPVVSKGESTLKIPFKLNFLQMGQSASQLLSGNMDIQYDLKGSFGLESHNPLLGNVRMPFDRSGTVKVQR